jgi:hypothetical protein
MRKPSGTLSLRLLDKNQIRRWIVLVGIKKEIGMISFSKSG